MRAPSAGGLAAVIAVVLGLTMAGPAEAAYVRSGTFGAGELSLTAQSDVAIDQGAGTVYLADTGNDRIAKYSPAGSFLGNLATMISEPTFLAVDNSSGGSTGDVYVVDQGNETITKLTSAGAPVASWGTAGSMGGFGQIAGITVDHSGNLWVLGVDRTMHELSPTGSQSSSCTAPRTNVLARGIGVDSSDDLYYVRGENVEVVKISSTCEKLISHVAEGDGDEWVGLGISEADDSIFLSKGHEVRHYSSNATTRASLLEAFGPSEGLESAAQLTVRSANEAVYVADIGNQDVAIFEQETVAPPEVIFEEPNGVTGVTGTTAHFKAEINPNSNHTKYQFHCSPDCSAGTGLQGELSAGTAFETVEATAEGLLPGTEYNVWITATNAGGCTRAPGAGGAGEEECPTPPEPEEGLSFTTGSIAPSITEETVGEVTETTAAVEAVIHSGGAPTEYWVQYVTRAQFETSEFTAAQETAEEFVATGAERVSMTLSGLDPSTPYVFRFVATNAVGEAEGDPIAFATQEPSLLPTGPCPNEIFRTEASAALPDCRAYEQSTPVDKNGGGVQAVPGAVLANEGPDSITFYSQAGVPGGVGAQDLPTYISSRGEAAWATQGLLPPQSLGRQAIYLGLTPGGRYALTSATGANANGESLGTGLFRRDLRGGEMATIVPYEPECEETNCFFLAGASTDGSRIFFESTAPLTEETPPGQRNVFLWEEGSGVSLVDVDGAGDPLPEGGYAGPYDWPEEDLERGGTRNHFYVGPVNAISPDGSQLVFTEAQESGGEEGKGQLYVRKGMGGPSPTSIKISAYREGRSGPELPAAFLEATPDGRYVFFKSKAALTGGSYAGEAGHESASLYRYDVATGALVDLTPDPAEEREDGPGVEGMLGVSDSGDVSGKVAYFVATAVLTDEEEGPSGETATLGQPNLYRWQEGAPLAFIATLKGGVLANAGGDTRDWSPAILASSESTLAKTARVSDDGGSVVFSSSRALTGAPNPAGAAEFFRYSAATDTLDCISCDPTGARPLGDATIAAAYIDSSDQPLAKAPPVLPHNLSADGRRFFFQTPDPLVAADINGRSGCGPVPTNDFETIPSCLDVYEWEAPGSGTCPVATANANGGCLHLLSTGQSNQPSYFADADRDGSNAYFFTTSPLVPADGDQNYDIYDAREFGGLASQHPPQNVPCGSRQACQGPQAGTESSTTPGTSSFNGPGNPPASKNCRKGFVRRHGRCVKKARHHKQRHRKHHHRKGHKGKGHKKRRAGGADAKRRAGHGRGGRK